MATIRLPIEFKEFLSLLNSERVEYLVLGGYAVNYHGYSRATGDLDIWIAISPENAGRIVRVLERFGFAAGTIPAEWFLQARKTFRMGVPPLRIELLTRPSGVEFSDCHARRVIANLDGVAVSLIHLDDLKANKKAAGRTKDLNDLEHLP